MKSSSALRKFSAQVCPGWFSANCLGSFCLLKVTGKGSLPELGRATSLTSMVSSARKQCTMQGAAQNLAKNLRTLRSLRRNCFSELTFPPPSFFSKYSFMTASFLGSHLLSTLVVHWSLWYGQDGPWGCPSFQQNCRVQSSQSYRWMFLPQIVMASPSLKSQAVRNLPFWLRHFSLLRKALPTGRPLFSFFSSFIWMELSSRQKRSLTLRLRSFSRLLSTTASLKQPQNLRTCLSKWTQSGWQS